MPEPNYVADNIGGCRSSYDLIQLNNIVSIAPNECAADAAKQSGFEHHDVTHPDGTLDVISVVCVI